MEHTKAAAKAIKAAGLQKLAFYCQPCGKQCRDANGFRNHCETSGHLARAGDRLGAAKAEYLARFEQDFLRLLRTSHGENRIDAHRLYQEYIRDRHHVHMNSTRWLLLTQFVAYLGRSGKCRVDEGRVELGEEPGLHLRYVDTLLAAAANRQLARQMDEEEVQERVRAGERLERQMQKARADETAAAVETAPTAGALGSAPRTKVSIGKMKTGKVAKPRTNPFKSR